MILVKPSLKDHDQIMAYRAAFLKNGETPYGGSSLHRFNNFSNWLNEVESKEKGENLAPNKVPGTQFLCVEKNDLIGLINIRHWLTSELIMNGGHIGLASIQKSEGKAMQLSSCDLA